VAESPFCALAGMFLVLDGPDGAGKTTALRSLAGLLRQEGLVVTECKDPGGTAVGDRIRAVLLGGDHGRLDVRCETLLFMASRAQLINERIRPALARGEVVVCDRFVSATCAYQVAGGADFDEIIELARYATDDTWPDLTLVLDVPVDVGFGRIGHRRGQGSAANRAEPAGAPLDNMERRSAAFHESVRQHFLALPGRYPAPIDIIDAATSPEVVLGAIVQRLTAYGAARARRDRARSARL